MPEPSHAPDPATIVTEANINVNEVFRRGGQNLGDEDFEFIKCPLCNAVFLADTEVDTLYLDAGDLAIRDDWGDMCPRCNQRWVPVELGYRPRREWDVTWDEFERSDWSWAATRPAPK